MVSRRIHFEEGYFRFVALKNYSHIATGAQEILAIAKRLNETGLLDNKQLRDMKITCTHRVTRRAKLYATKTYGAVSRAKRGLGMEFVGSALKWVSGTPDANDWKDNIAALKDLERQANRTRQNQVKFHRHEEMTDKVLKRTSKVLRKLEKGETELGKATATMEQKLRDAINVVDVCLELQALLEDLDEENDRLERARLQANFNLATEELVPPHLLERQLSRLAGRSRLTPIWPTDEVQQYYQNRLATVQIRDLTVLTSLRIPLVDKSRTYTTHNTAMQNGEMIAVEDSGASYRYMPREEVANCEELLNGELLCQGRVTGIYRTRHLCSTEECATESGLPFDRLIELSAERFAFRFNDSSSASVVCPKTPMRTMKLKRSGILTVPKDCKVSGDGFFINAAASPAGSTKVQVEEWEPEFEAERVVEHLSQVSTQLEKHVSTHDKALNETNMMKKDLTSIKMEISQLTNATSGVNDHDELLSDAHDRLGHMENRVDHHTTANTVLVGVLLLVVVVTCTIVCCRISGVNRALSTVNQFLRLPARQSTRHNPRAHFSYEPTAREERPTSTTAETGVATSPGANPVASNSCCGV